MKKKKIHKITMPIYPLTFYYSSCDKVMDKKFNLDHKSYGEYGGYCFAVQGENAVAMYFPHDKGSVIIPDLVHECLHAAMFAADIIGLRPTLEANESVAYLAQWFSETVLDLAHKESKNGK